MCCLKKFFQSSEKHAIYQSHNISVILFQILCLQALISVMVLLQFYHSLGLVVVCFLKKTCSLSNIVIIFKIKN